MVASTTAEQVAGLVAARQDILFRQRPCPFLGSSSRVHTCLVFGRRTYIRAKQATTLVLPVSLFSSNVALVSTSLTRLDSWPGSLGMGRELKKRQASFPRDCRHSRKMLQSIRQAVRKLSACTRL